jgi:hypothetical protein
MLNVEHECCQYKVRWEGSEYGVPPRIRELATSSVEAHTDL